MIELFASATQRGEVRYVWSGSSLLVLQHDGWAGVHPLTGYYFRQTRYLKDLSLRVGGEPPYICSIAEAQTNVMEATYIHPEVDRGGGGGSGSGGDDSGRGMVYRNLDMTVRHVVHPASLDVVLQLTNRWHDQLAVDLAWRLSADHATMDDAQFNHHEKFAAVEARAADNGVRFVCMHADLPFGTHVECDVTRWSYEDGLLQGTVELERQQTTTLTLRIAAIDPVMPIDADGSMQREATLDRWRETITVTSAPGEPPFTEYVNRAALDLGSMALLEGPEEEWLTPGAGVPLYQALWARDALTSSWQAGLLDRGDMIASVTAGLARQQGTVVDPARDEEPGRIINQVKLDAASRLGETGLDRNYADAASPFMFVIAFGYHYALTGDKAHVARHYDAAMRVLQWADTYGDRDGDGYIEYLTRAPKGPTHQAWKDSENAVVYDDGSQVQPPIAPCEIQGYWYVSLQFMATLSVVMGERARGLELWKRAAALKERFNRDYWMVEEGFVAFGLDAEKKQIRALTSNAGQCLATGIVDSDNVPRLVRRLFEPDLFSGWGIRTLSTGNPAYHPLDYHLGAVWPVENATTLLGLRRYGYNDRALQLTRALYDLARLWPQGRIPECVGGYARDALAHPGVYPRANRPQTWNQTIWPILQQTLLGLVPFAPLKLLFVDPILPPWLPELNIARLRVGAATVSLHFHRDSDGDSHFEVVELQGELHVVRQPWIESVSVNLWDRLGGLVDTVRNT